MMTTPSPSTARTLPEGVLHDIVAATRTRIISAERDTPLKNMLRLAHQQPPTRGFIKAIQECNNNAKVALIAETKARSPSSGTLVSETYDPAHICFEYQRCGACCVSVLTEPQWFGGDIKHIHMVKQAINLPVLRKDFIIDRYQIAEARAAGADCILLIMRILTLEQAHDLHQFSMGLGLDVLVEVHDAADLDQALNIDGLTLLGVNNRNLNTLKTDLNTFATLSQKASEAAMKKQQSSLTSDNNNSARAKGTNRAKGTKSSSHSLLLVCESGLKTPEDILWASQQGAQAVLVGAGLFDCDEKATHHMAHTKITHNLSANQSSQ